jgi:photosystem II stability/assembly factor-like uncharacterized protein
MPIMISPRIIVSILLLFFPAIASSQWTRTNGPSKYDYINSLATNENWLFATNQDSGVFRSSDDGSNWQNIYLNSGLSQINTLAVIDSFVFIGTTDGIQRSTDNGLSWTEKALSEIYIENIAKCGTTLFAGSYGYNNVYSSTDNGTTWLPLRITGLNNANVQAMVASGTNLYLAAYQTTGEGGLFLTTNYGTNWTLLKAGFEGGITDLAVMGSDIYAATFFSGIFRSTDKGNSWNKINGLPYAARYFFGIIDTALFTGIYDCGVFYSSNRGRSWSTVNQGLSDSSVCSILLTDKYLYVGTGLGAVWRRPLSEMIGANAVEKPAATIGQSVQVYPNPSSQSTTIAFSTTERSRATARIVNLLGEQVQQLFIGDLEAGDHSFSWDARKAPAGNYFAIIRTNDHVERVPIMVVH